MNGQKFNDRDEKKMSPGRVGNTCRLRKMQRQKQIYFSLDPKRNLTVQCERDENSNIMLTLHTLHTLLAVRPTKAVPANSANTCPQFR